MTHLQTLQFDLAFVLISQKIIKKYNILDHLKLLNVMIILPINFYYFINFFINLTWRKMSKNRYVSEKVKGIINLKCCAK